MGGSQQSLASGHEGDQSAHGPGHTPSDDHSYQ